MCQGSQDGFDQGFYSFSADGHVCSWELDAEQNCDVYRLVVRAPPCSGLDSPAMRMHHTHMPLPLPVLLPLLLSGLPVEVQLHCATVRMIAVYACSS